MRKAFTLVELVFVIAVLGILSAVAIGKFVTMRDDALNARDCKNIAICITDLAADYTAKIENDKNASKACRLAESSSYNNINIGVNATSVTVSGAPLSCSWLNTTIKYGGTRVSY